MLGLGSTDPKTELWSTAMWAVILAFASATQDIALDAFRIEIASVGGLDIKKSYTIVTLRPPDSRNNSENEAITLFGATALPVWLVVKKSRELWMLGNVRIHLDTVDKLGGAVKAVQAAFDATLEADSIHSTK
mgnify:CR=1 FL=1